MSVSPLKLHRRRSRSPGFLKEVPRQREAAARVGAVARHGGAAGGLRHVEDPELREVARGPRKRAPAVAARRRRVRAAVEPRSHERRRAGHDEAAPGRGDGQRLRRRVDGIAGLVAIGRVVSRLVSLNVEARRAVRASASRAAAGAPQSGREAREQTYSHARRRIRVSPAPRARARRRVAGATRRPAARSGGTDVRSRRRSQTRTR